MAEKIDNATTRVYRAASPEDEYATISAENLLTCLGVRTIGFDPLAVVYAQESTWVLDMRIIANSPATCIDFREHVRTLSRAYYRHRRGGHSLRIIGWSGVTFI